ncbi:MAG: hypothetical protein AVDCRST_MAG86-3644 [uncultured Truepera sp.]|uniref:Uncharacterized protein n=1 Tax=uncultured Truepera sp. TaxID=543023 RepID=A0A6J4VRF7_9DEIN|nr:MAG: hypothetical protein AVDCRST_MAG86-3644 [uncultured Truepera sp.]
MVWRYYLVAIFPEARGLALILTKPKPLVAPQGSRGCVISSYTL